MNTLVTSIKYLSSMNIFRFIYLRGHFQFYFKLYLIYIYIIIIIVAYYRTNEISNYFIQTSIVLYIFLKDFYGYSNPFVNHCT